MIRAADLAADGWTNPTPTAVYPLTPAGSFWACRQPTGPGPYLPDKSRCGRPHRGIDLNASRDDDVLSPAPGVVQSISLTDGGGFVMTILHEVRGSVVFSKHLHLLADSWTSRGALEGKRVERGEPVAGVGKTGKGINVLHNHTEIALVLRLTNRRSDYIDPEIVYYGKGEGHMRLGDQGPSVRKLQERLLEKGFDIGELGADSDFGPKTEAAVQSFQKTSGLTESGEADSITTTFLFI